MRRTTTDQSAWDLSDQEYEQLMTMRLADMTPDQRRLRREAQGLESFGHDGDFAGKTSIATERLKRRVGDGHWKRRLTT